MPVIFWPFAFTTAAYLINRLPTHTLHNQSPFYKLFQKHPNYNKLRSFGCLCYPWLRPYSPHKLHSRSTPCIFVGYSPTQSAYYSFDPTTYKTYSSRHVVFVDNDFPFERLTNATSNSSTSLTYQSSTDWVSMSLPISTSNLPNPTPTVPTFEKFITPHSTPTKTTSTVSPSPNISTSTSPQIAPLSPPSTSFPSQHISTSNTSSPSPNTNSHLLPPPSQTETTSFLKPTTRSNPKPNSRYHNSDFHLYTNTPSAPIEPQTITQALKHPSWRRAMQEEFDALQRNNTWTLVPPTFVPNLVGCKWVYRTKYKPDGSVDRLKARLVAKGFTQRPGIDYIETFSPVLKPATLRLVLSLVVSQGWSLRQLDINNAFLQGTLNEDVFMAQPPGFINPSFPTHVCKLNKAIYGLRQASRAWYDELKSFLISHGFKSTISDSSLFTLIIGSSPIFILVYVDDIIITGPSNTLIARFINLLSAKFSLKDLGSLSYFLGIEILSHPHGVVLSQKKYISDILHKANMSDCKPISTPITCSEPLTLHGGTTHPNPTEYRTIVGALQYLSLTRPDVAFTVNKLSQYMHAPTSHHWTALKRLLRYLNGTLHHGILLRYNSPLHLHAFTDADWAGDKDNYRSTTGYIVYLGANPISWSSKRQSTLARSSTEA